MKPAVIIGIVLIVVGVIGFAWGGLGWTTQKKDAQLGPLEITHKESHRIAFPPIASGICLAGGIILVLVGSRKGQSPAFNTAKVLLPLRSRYRRTPRFGSALIRASRNDFTLVT